MEEVAYDDPIWEFILRERLARYIPVVREWWSKVSDLEVDGTGIYPITDDPPGLMYRMTKSTSKSPIKNVQVFPFVPSAYLQIKGVAGGSTKMCERVCAKGLIMDEFTIIEKHNLPSTYNQGQLLAFIPTDVLAGSRALGKYVYLTIPELEALSQCEVLRSVKLKADNHKIII